MDQLKLAPSKLFVSTSLETKDELEEKFERAFQYVQQQTNGLNDKELHELLSQLVCKEKHHEDISIGLLYIILTDCQLAPKTYRDLTLLSRDGLNLVNSSLTMLVADKYMKLTDGARRQLLWLLRELVKNQVMNVDNTMWNCLRQASGGDVSARNLLLVEGLLDIFIDYRQWLEKFPFLIGTVVYTYVRLIEDHTSNLFTNLKNKEVKFVISLIRERFTDIIPLGRDFVRLLQNVAKIPEFDQLWRDILFNPKVLCPTFNGIWHLLQIRTSRRYVQCRVTPEVERKLIFFASSVKFGSQKRYQDWFQDKYLATPESQSLRSDLIRFIINVIHPTNDMLCSDIIPRWAIIGWLLTSCTNPVALANAKLSLFYDWLFFDPNKDNIMNIEPGILVMYHSLRNHPFVSCTLLDFLCRIMKNFFPKSEDKIRIGVYNSLKQILEKQVIPNLQPLFESPKLDRELRNLIRDSFREFCGISSIPGNMTPPDGMMINQSNAFRKNLMDEHRNILNMDDNRTPANFVTYNHLSYVNDGFRFGNAADELQESQEKINSVQREEIPGGDQEPEPTFSDEDEENNLEIRNEELTDDDDDLPLSKVRLKEKPAADKIELPVAISESLEIFLEKKTSSTFETFINDYRTLSISAIDTLQQDYVVTNVYLVLKETLPGKIFADSKNDEKLLSESISYPIFTLFRIMYTSEDKNKKPFQQLINALYEKMPLIGYLLLYFLKVYSKLQSRKNSSQNYNYKIGVYKQFCDALDEKVDKCLVRDLSSLENESANIFLWIIPDIYRELKSSVINDSDIIRIILSCIDAKNLRDLIYSVTQGKLVLFKKDGLIDCIRESLSYETFEQFCFWQLVQAHDVPIEYIQEIIPDLEASNHAEALTYLLLLIKNEEPTTELIRLLLSRETKSRGDPFVTSSLRLLCGNYEERLSEIIASLLTSKYPNSSPNKRKRPNKSSSTVNSAPSSEQLLNHLEHFRRSCRHGNGTGTGLYVQDSMQRALQQAHSHSSDSTKKQFNDLFSLAAEDETSSVGRRGTSGRGRKQPNNKKDVNNTSNNTKKNSEPVNNLYTSDEESSEEDWSKPKQSKRRKKALSDSD